MIIRSRAVPRGNPSDGREASMWGGEKSWVFSIFYYDGGDIINGWDCELMILFSHVLEREREEKRRDLVSLVRTGDGETRRDREWLFIKDFFFLQNKKKYKMFFLILFYNCEKVLSQYK